MGAKYRISRKASRLFASCYSAKGGVYSCRVTITSDARCFVLAARKRRSSMVESVPRKERRRLAESTALDVLRFERRRNQEISHRVGNNGERLGRAATYR